MKTTNKKTTKVLSILIALVMVAGTFPLSGIRSLAADEDSISVQYLVGEVAQSGKSIKIKTLDSAEIASGTTDSRGIVSDIISFSDLPLNFVVSVDGNNKTIQKKEEYYKYLIINSDEKSWENKPLELSSITVSADKESYYRGDKLVISSSVKGTADSYKWYKGGTLISGETGAALTINSLALSDSGTYKCEAKDETNSTTKSAEISINVTEAESGSVMNVYSKGSQIAFSNDEATVPYSNGSAKIELSYPADAEIQTKVLRINGNSAPDSDEFAFEPGIQEYTITASLEFTKKYQPVQLTRTLKINGEPQTEIEAEITGAEYNSEDMLYELDYTSDLKINVNLSNGDGSGDYRVEVIDDAKGIAGAVVSPSDSSKWTVNISGAGSFKLRLSKSGDGHYADSAVKTMQFKVNKISVTGFVFETPEPEEVTYNENGNKYNNAIALNIDGIKYSVIAGDDCAEINENTGEVTVLSSGTARIKAELAATDNYEAASAEYSLTINRADQAVEFEGASEDEDPIRIYYGQSYTRAATPIKVDEAADGYGYNHDEDSIQYKVVVEDGEEAIASVDENGKLIFEDGRFGTVTVVATLAANGCYNEAQAEYTLIIDGTYDVENPYTITGTKSEDGNEWYIDDITIVPAENHTVSYSNAIENNEWADSLTISTEGTENGKTIYVRNKETGAVSVAYDIPSESVKLDKTSPSDLSIEFETEKWYEAVIDAITYNFYNSSVVFHFEAKDDLSGVKEFKWSDIEGDFTDGENPEEGEESAEYQTATVKEISNGVAVSENYSIGDAEDLQEFKGKISFSATDNAGNISTRERTYIIIDTDEPALAISATKESKSVVNSNHEVSENPDENTIEVFDEKTSVTCSIQDKNFFSDRVSVSINGQSIPAGTITDSGDNHFFTISENYFTNTGDYTIELKYTDIFGPDSDNKEEKDEYTLTKQICIDAASPEIGIELPEADEDVGSVKYYKTESVKAKITVNEFIFDPSKIVFTGLDEETKAPLYDKNNWQESEGGYSAEIIFADEGTYSFTATLTDVAGNTSETAESGDFIIDRTAPAIGFAYAPDNVLLNADRIVLSSDAPESEINTVYDKEKAIITVAVTEKNFDPDKVELTVDGQSGSFDNSEWVKNGDTYTNNITINENSDKPNHTVSVKCTDIPGNNFEKDTPNIRVSSELPRVSIEIKGFDSEGNELPKSEDGKYNFGKDVNNVSVKVSVFDINFPATELPVERGNYSVKATDFAGTNIDEVPEIQNGAYSDAWSEGPNTEEYQYVYTFNYDKEGRYSFSTVYNGLDGVEGVPAESNFIIDRTEPEFEITFSEPVYETIMDAITYKLYNSGSGGKALTVTVTATDNISGVKDIDLDYSGFLDENVGHMKPNGAQVPNENGEASWEFIVSMYVELRGTVYPTVTDICGNSTGNDEKTDVGIDNMKPIVQADLIPDQDLLEVEEEDVSEEQVDSLPQANNGIAFFVKDSNFDEHQFEVTFEGKDIGDNKADTSEIKNNGWTVETQEGSHKGWHKTTYNGFADGLYTATATATDDAGNVSEEFSTQFIVDRSSPYDLNIAYSTPKATKTVNGVTYNYYNSSFVATLSATDSITGVTQFDWYYDREKGASETNLSSDHDFEPLENGRSEREASVDINIPRKSSQQYRGNMSLVATDRANNISEKYTDKKTVVIVDTISPTRTVEFSQPINTDGDFDNGGKAYYDGEATATIKIVEANFYPEDVDLKVNDEAYSDVNWVKNGDVWTGTVNFSQDGHYIMSLNYSDRSTNKMEEYVSGEVIVDNLKPSIQVSYSPDNPVYSSGSRKYYSENQTATITITEHNFDPSGVKVGITAKDISGSDMSSDIGSSLSWKREGDVNTATITYSSDANYTFEISCTDLAKQVSDTYGPDELTIDKTPPANLSIGYSTSVLDSVISGVTFGYYNAPVTVTVKTSDNISGVESFEYSYTDKVTNRTETGTIKANAGGANATATFKVPASATQFNGDLKVRATDNSGNKTSYFAKNETLIVDSIAPQSNIQLNAPVTTSGGTSYYAGTVTADISIEEANFYPEDISILVDGSPVTPSGWSSNGDIRTATVSVSSDGSHTISMSYTDRSGNEMNSYESQRFIIDHTPPVITVTGVKNQAAYKEDKVGFTITAQDANFGSGGFSPKLTAVVQNNKGGFETRDVDLSSSYSGSSGYSLSFDNIDEDGVYTLTCSARDFSGNTTSSMMSDGTPVNAITFSVNRNGSVYAVDEDTQKLIQQYYVKNVGNDVVISEINVDPLNEYSVKINNKELVKGKDYTVSSSGGDGEWYRYIYTISADNFKEENDYSIVVNSLDSTDTAAYSDIKGAEVMFTVDSTPPTVTLSGIEKNGRYQVSSQEVSLIPADDGGSIESLKIEVMDSSGKVTSTPIDVAGEDLDALLEKNDGVLKFNVGQGIRQTVKITCVDKAGNVYDSNGTYSNITVSSSKAVLLWSSNGFKVAAGLSLAALAGLIILLVAKKKKKEDK